MLTLSLTQLPRLLEIENNTQERLTEARQMQWLGEVAALEESIKHLRIRQSEAQQRLSHGSNPFADQRPQ